MGWFEVAGGAAVFVAWVVGVGTVAAQWLLDGCSMAGFGLAFCGILQYVRYIDSAGN
jgi:hypothetical protein